MIISLNHPCLIGFFNSIKPKARFSAHIAPSLFRIRRIYFCLLHLICVGFTTHSFLVLHIFKSFWCISWYQNPMRSCIDFVLNDIWVNPGKCCLEKLGHKKSPKRWGFELSILSYGSFMYCRSPEATLEKQLVLLVFSDMCLKKS